MQPVVYNSDYYNTTLRGDGDDTLGFAFLAPLIGAAPGIFSAITSLFGGGRKAQFQGLAEINQAGQKATAAMDQIAAALTSGQMPPTQAVSDAQKIVDQFNDPAIVYPAQKGDDAAARNNFIAKLNQQLQAIQSAAASVAQTQQQQADAAGGDLLGGISTNTLLLVGGGLAVVFMLSRNNG